MSHTPGPWKLEMKRATWNPDGDEFYPDHVVDEKGNHVRFAGVTITSHNPESTANSRLAAAAPDLLSAMQKIVGIYDSYGTGWYNTDEFCEGLKEARAAIAKAEGK